MPKVELTPCVILSGSGFSRMEVTLLEPQCNSGLAGTLQKCCVDGEGLFGVIVGDALFLFQEARLSLCPSPWANRTEDLSGQ